MENIFKFMLVRPIAEADPDFVIQILKNEVHHESDQKGATKFLNDNKDKISSYEVEFDRVLSNKKLKKLLESGRNVYGIFPDARSRTQTGSSIRNILLEPISKLQSYPTASFLKKLIVATIKTDKELTKGKLVSYCNYLKFKFIMDTLLDNEDVAFSVATLNKLMNTPIFIEPHITEERFFHRIKQHVPHTHGSVQPSGISDLKVVKQQLKGYASGDIVHIENVLKGENKLHQTTKTKTQEDYIYSEIEKLTEKETELETSDRFELSKAASQSITEEEAYGAGVGVSGSYGPTKFAANAGANFSSSAQQSAEQSSEYAKEVTQKAIEKITEKVTNRESKKIISSIEDVSKHEFDNTAGETNISGVYQWIDKLYEAQIYNYGKRQMYDLMVPEPAAYYLNALQQGKSQRAKPPIPFPEKEGVTKPSEIDENNYVDLIAKYGVTTITCPPEKNTFISESYKVENTDSKTQEVVKSNKVNIPAGYQAVSASYSIALNDWVESDWYLHLGIANHNAIVEQGDINNPSIAGGIYVWQQPQQRDNGEYTTVRMRGDQKGKRWGSGITTFPEPIMGMMDLIILTFRVNSFAVSVSIKCERTDDAYKKWQLDTFNTLLENYKQQQSDYDEELFREESMMGLSDIGNSPLENKQLIHNELKKHAITIITNQNFRHFDSIKEASNEEIDVKESQFEGRYIRFFEQAFEWKNMTYKLYPYFWGRKEKWIEKLHYTDNDTLFKDFIKSGSCRIALPVRPGFENAISFFMATGEVWEGDDLPQMGDKYYVSLAQELSEELGRSQGEKAEGEPWEVRVPTNLIKLRKDDNLPEWEKSEDGSWVEKGVESNG